MIRINLLPFRAARIKEKIRLQVSIYALSVIFLFLVLSIFPYNPYSYLNLSKEIENLGKEQEAKQKELDSFKEIKAKIKALQDDIADLNVKRNTIKELEKGKTGPVKLLDDIATSVPKNKLWLTVLNEKGGNLVLEGTAMDNETVADFMNRLEATDSVNSVTLLRTKQRQIKELKLNLKDFALNCRTSAFKEKAPPKAKPKPGKKRGR